MSGSIAAIAAYDGTGTQGYGTTDKSLPGVKSIFWNENDTDKYYVNGSCYAELECNIESKTEIEKKETYIFTIPNDYDAVDQIKLAISTYNSSGDALDNTINPNSYAIIKDHPGLIIEKIEFCIGNQIICTQSGFQLISNTNYNKNLIYLSIIPGMTQSGANYAYLSACANNQMVQLKVYIKNKEEIKKALGLETNDDIQIEELEVRAYANFYSMTNEERNMLRGKTLPKAFPITQYSDRVTVPNSLVKGESQITINCDHFNIDCSYIEVSYLTYNDNEIKFDIELFLNSTSYSGVLQNHFSRNLLNHHTDYTCFIPLRLNNVSSLTNQTPSTDQIIFDKSGLVPLSKYDSIRIVLTLANKPGSSTDIHSNIINIQNNMTATAHGLCTALYQNGSVVFNNY